MLFHRLVLSKDKEGVLKFATQGHEVLNHEDLFKEHFVLEFLNIPRNFTFLLILNYECYMWFAIYLCNN